ncbi:MAG: hypothetical protein RMX68_006055 [Aulosira sp. ZfuVER01]|nr:hypothetical protein [Aulosira sp. ZfuVER01]MDZ8001487.1 hypothetical protein [Aulosira sp. DedVER01a]MDZ8051645.1 hypothetical protein [Aulosira sp. ZfuCHP01]
MLIRLCYRTSDVWRQEAELLCTGGVIELQGDATQLQGDAVDFLPLLHAIALLPKIVERILPLPVLLNT